MKTFIRSIAVFAILIGLSQMARAADARITAQIEPRRIAVGEPAKLSVTVSGESDSAPRLPRVDGLDFTPEGQLSQYQSINGTVTSSTSFTYRVEAIREGSFTIPALTLGRGKHAAASSPLTLQVSGTANATRWRNQRAQALPRPNMPNDEGDSAPADNRDAFLRLVTPKREFYVGELVPVKIKAYFRAGLQAALSGLPTLNSAAFTLNAMGNKPAQTQEEINGQTFTVLTWTTALDGVKAGDYTLNLEMPITVTVRAKARRARGFFDDSLFDDAIFDDAFGRGVEKSVMLKSSVSTMKIKELPSENRPADFHGAVGRFDVAATAAPARIAAGDPITLKLNVTGQGNFDRVTSELLTASKDWKSYKPVARFAPNDSAGFAGTKPFEQAIMPLEAGRREIPPLSFSFFDPDAYRYLTRTTAPIVIDVAAAAGRSTIETEAKPPEAAPSAARASRVEFAPNRVERGSFY